MRHKVNILLAVGITAPLWVGIGRVTATPNPEPIQVTFAAPDTAESPTCLPITCPAPFSCPEPVECPVYCPTVHTQAVKAIGKVLVADAYVRGTEAKQEVCERYDALYDDPPRPAQDECCASCAYWENDFDLMQVGFTSMLLGTEASNWHRACEKLVQHWDTPETIEGNFPDDFPEFCK